MVAQLLSPSQPKNLSDILVLGILGLHLLLAWLLPSSIRALVIGIIFLFWRAGYNLGIGYLLHTQSHHQMLVRWARISKIFVNPATSRNPRPRLYAFLKREMETKIPKDYNFDTAPLEYNTWLLFRRVVDLILMCDFVTYILFALACAHQPKNEALMSTVIRWTVGPGLFLFNLWVKLDAHRVVKDFAWYWGDFFFLIDQELTFDGVFEMAPHPMYSIGYAGYYGIAMMAGSLPVLYISIVAHAAQFAFLWLVESPHIERTYSSPPPRRSEINETPRTASGQRPPSTRKHTADNWPTTGSNQPPATHNLVGLQNIDLYRTVDSSVIIIEILVMLLTFFTPSTTLFQISFVVFAAASRIWYSAGIGYLLNRQSDRKKWTRHFLKYGESTWEAWRQWKGVYHMSMILCYSSFAAAVWKVHTLPEDWNSGAGALRLVTGLCLIALQVWVAFSIYDQLGEFGWFFGDFFFDQNPKLTYGGIYRFLNNPERFLGVAGLWGLALITLNKAVIGLAFLSQVLSLAFIHLVERPHMQKLYGRSIRQDAGLVRTLRRSLPPPLRGWQEKMDRGLSEGFDIIEDLLEAAKEKFAAGYHHIAHDTKYLLQEYPARITITRVDPDIVGLDTKEYAVEFEPESSPDAAVTGKDSANGTPEDHQQPVAVDYGVPITVKWSAPLDHSKRDWIGLYRVSDNASREITRISSASRWTATNAGEFETAGSERGLVKSDITSERRTSDASKETICLTGTMVFAADKLFWTQGVFEFRYHHNGKHNVLAVSKPFEVRIPRFNEDDLESDISAASPRHEAFLRAAIEKTLLPVVQNCFERDPDIAPSTSQEGFGGLVERDGKFAQRVVYAVKEVFGVEFAPEVVKADGKVENLAWRIWEAKKVLVRPPVVAPDRDIVTLDPIE